MLHGERWKVPYYPKNHIEGVTKTVRNTCYTTTGDRLLPFYRGRKLKGYKTICGVTPTPRLVTGSILSKESNWRDAKMDRNGCYTTIGVFSKEGNWRGAKNGVRPHAMQGIQSGHNSAVVVYSIIFNKEICLQCESVTSLQHEPAGVAPTESIMFYTPRHLLRHLLESFTIQRIWDNKRPNWPFKLKG